jgi:hypothetical protein
MSLSTQQPGKDEQKNGLEILWELRVVFADIMHSFRECHDLCIRSGLFSEEAILKIDECALEFRHLTHSAGIIAKQVSNQWLSSTISFFENIDDYNDPKAMLVRLGTQAKELARCFQVIAAWARDLAGRFHDAQRSTSEESAGFTDRFEQAVQSASTTKSQLEEDLRKARVYREGVEDTRDDLRTTTLALIWFPFASIATGSGWAAIQHKLEDAREMEDETYRKLQNAQTDLEQKISQKEKAELISSKAATLVDVLVKLDLVCTGIAAFWTKQAISFNSQGAKMKTNQALAIQMLKKPTAKGNIRSWTEMKGLIDRYATVMTTIANSFDVETRAELPPSKVVLFANLSIVLNIPLSVYI